MGKPTRQLETMISLSPITREFIGEVESLSGLCDWQIPEPVAGRWIEVIRWGHALWMTRTIAGVDRVREKMACEIVECDAPTPDTLAELSAAGLCVALGATMAGRILEGASRTADWRMVWPVGAEVDVEVTVGRKKKAHLEREKAGKTLCTELFNELRSFDLVIDLLDPTNKSHYEAARKASGEISEGEVLVQPGCWEVRAESITREPNVIFIGGQNQRPNWWPDDHARNCSFYQMVAGHDTKKAPPQVCVWTGLPFVSYINPVMRKANSPQGTKSLPFLICVDVAFLPGAFREIPRVADGFLQLWTVVSGILLYRDIASFDFVGWRWLLILNHNAIYPLPKGIVKGCGAASQPCDLVVNIGNRCGDR